MYGDEFFFDYVNASELKDSEVLPKLSPLQPVGRCFGRDCRLSPYWTAGRAGGVCMRMIQRVHVRDEAT